MDYHSHNAASRTRTVGLAALLLAGFTLLVSTIGQASILFIVSMNSIPSRLPCKMSSIDMLSAFVTFLSIVGGSWVLALAKPKESIPRDLETEPLLDTFTDEKVVPPSGLEISEKRDYLRSVEVIYLPYFIAGNLCVGLWSLLWLSEWYITSQIALLANLIIQNYAIFIALHSWSRSEWGLDSKTWLTHVLVKGNAAVAILFLWANSRILERSMSPTLLEMLNNGTIFVLMAIGGGPDPTLALFLLYDLCALAYGTGAAGEWQVAFQYTALMVLFVLAWDLFEWATKPSSKNMMDHVDDDIVEGEIMLQPENEYRRL